MESKSAKQSVSESESIDRENRAAMGNVASTQRTAAPPWQPNEQSEQYYYTYSSSLMPFMGEWKPTSSMLSTDSQRATTTLSTISILSWNIDFMIPNTSERMQAALDHVEDIITNISKPTVIMFQEMLVVDLKLIQDSSWIRQRFNITDINTANWTGGYYGTCTLIDKRLPINRVFRIHYGDTKMERDGLFVDLTFDNQLVRVCNTHLESLAIDPPLRPKQLAVAAKAMHSPVVAASILGGDLNAIQDFDKSLHTENNLKDAYLETGGLEGAEEGMTWGQQARKSQRKQYGLSRMDKILYCGKARCTNFEIFGRGVHIDEERFFLGPGFDKPWVTDHLGVRADFEILPGAAEADASKL